MHNVSVRVEASQDEPILGCLVVGEGVGLFDPFCEIEVFD